jgi:acyl-CoA thioesterase-1
VAQFNAIYPRLAKEFDVVFVPFFLEGVAMKSELTLGDGLHPNARGYAIITENIFPYVVQAIEKRAEK